MPFTKPPRPIPSKIGRITIDLVDEDGDSNKIAANVSIEILSSLNEASGNFNGNLLPHLTTAQKSGIVSLFAAIRTKALAELI